MLCQAVFHPIYKITLLRVTPTMALQGIYSDILPIILSDISSDILSAILSGILSGIYSGILSGIYSILASILAFYLTSIIHSDILSGILSDVLFSWGSGQEGNKREVEGRGGAPCPSTSPQLQVPLQDPHHCLARGTLCSRGCCSGPAGNAAI